MDVLDATGVEVARGEEEVKECDLVGLLGATGVLDGATELEEICELDCDAPLETGELEAFVLEVTRTEDEADATDELEGVWVLDGTGVSKEIGELDGTGLLE